MRAASNELPQIMGKAADVSTSGTHHAKFCERRLETKQLELFNPNSNRRNLDTLKSLALR